MVSHMKRPLSRGRQATTSARLRVFSNFRLFLGASLSGTQRAPNITAAKFFAKPVRSAVCPQYSRMPVPAAVEPAVLSHSNTTSVTEDLKTFSK